MRARLDVARAWMNANARPYFYAGPGKGAVPAAWRQAAWAEVAARSVELHYAIVLLDLAKACERIPHWFLVRQARKRGYSMVLLRLSAAAYRLARVIGVNGVYSSLLVASRGITAGSVFATVEMRIVVLEALDYVVDNCLSVRLTCYVDDVALDMAGTAGRIVEKLPVATVHFTAALQRVGMEFCDKETQ
jgi:hypothetical protein